MKKFYDEWGKENINDYVEEHFVIILFKIHKGVNEAELMIHGKLNDKQKLLLKVCVIGKFGGAQMTESVCVEINEYAKEWYKDYVLAQKIRVLNFKRKR